MHTCILPIAVVAQSFLCELQARMESHLWHEDACSQNGDEHFEDACGIMVVSRTCGMKMLEGDEQEHFADPSQLNTLQIQLKTLQGEFNQVNASSVKPLQLPTIVRNYLKKQNQKQPAHNRKHVFDR